MDDWEFNDCDCVSIFSSTKRHVLEMPFVSFRQTFFSSINTITSSAQLDSHHIQRFKVKLLRATHSRSSHGFYPSFAG